MTTSRRNFFKIIGALPLAAALPRNAAAQPQPAPSATRLLLNRFSIAGFQYYDGPALLRRLRPGKEYIYTVQVDGEQTYETTRQGVKGINPARLKSGAALKLTAEPENPHDPFAVQIHIGKAKLGYVPRSDNRHINRLLEQGAQLECRVIHIETGNRIRDRVRVEVWLT